MSYERYKDYRLAPDDNGCWDVLSPNYENMSTHPSKAAAKRAIDELAGADAVPAHPKKSESIEVREIFEREIKQAFLNGKEHHNDDVDYPVTGRSFQAAQEVEALYNQRIAALETRLKARNVYVDELVEENERMEKIFEEIVYFGTRAGINKKEDSDE